MIQTITKHLKTSRDFNALGFNRKETESVAAIIADNLKSAHPEGTADVTPEEVAANLGDLLPVLRLVQSSASRQARTAQLADDLAKQTLAEATASASTPATPAFTPANAQPAKEPAATTPAAAADPLAELLKRVESLSAELATMKAQGTAASRRDQVAEAVKDAHASFQQRTLRDFDRMAFKDNDQFTEYLNDLQADIKQDKQERANSGLAFLGLSPAGTPHQPAKVLSDDDVKALAHV